MQDIIQSKIMIDRDNKKIIYKNYICLTLKFKDIDEFILKVIKEADKRNYLWVLDSSKTLKVYINMDLSNLLNPFYSLDFLLILDDDSILFLINLILENDKMKMMLETAMVDIQKELSQELEKN